MNLIDTQVLAYVFSNRVSTSLKGATISSSTAKEFLLVQGRDSSLDYYVPLLSRFRVPDGATARFYRRDHPFSKLTTDQILLDFGPNFGATIEHSNLAVAETINSRELVLFKEAMRFIDKQRAKYILKRLDFLLDQGVTCVAPNRCIVETGLVLLKRFLETYFPKNDPRNTVADILVLATAIERAATLVSEDSLLNRFAAECYNAKAVKEGDRLTISFREPERGQRRVSKESKGYINTGWRARVRNYQGAW